MAYTVYQADENALEPELRPIWQRNLQIVGDLSERFRWSHQENPAGPCVTFLLRHQGEDGSSAVGSTTIFPRQLRVFGQQLRGGILGDVAVDRAHRTLFPALALQRSARDFARANLDVLYGLPNDAALPLYDRLRLSKLGHMVRYARPLRIEDNLPAELPVRWLLRPAAGLVDRAIGAWDRLRRRTTPLGYSLRWLQRPDERFDALWQRRCDGFTLVGQRDRAFLHWRFCQQPVGACRFAILESGEQIGAYAVVQVERKVALLRDLFASDARQMHRLLQLLVPSLREQGLRSVSFRMLGAPWLVDLLGRHGFRAREQGWNVVIDPSESLPVARDVLLDPSHWYLTDADEDDM